jgi:hypothetical protein
MTATMATIVPYLGFTKALKKWGTEDNASIAWDLKWQKEVDGNAQKKSSRMSSIN